MRVAVLEDDPAQREQLCAWLRAEGHATHGYGLARDLLAVVRRETFDLVLIDWELPDESGLSVLRWMRRNLASPVPVLFVTHRDAEEDVVAALEAGADDFMAKPVQRAVLRARVVALLRRAYPARSAETIDAAPYRFDAARREVMLAGAPVELRAKEFDLALEFFRNPGRILSRAHLLETIWQSRERDSDRTVDTHVSALRSKLALKPENGYRVAPVYGFGYRLEALASRPEGARP